MSTRLRLEGEYPPRNVEQPGVIMPPFKVPAAVASAVSTAAAREGITRTDVARRALLFDLRNRGLLREAATRASMSNPRRRLLLTEEGVTPRLNV